MSDYSYNLWKLHKLTSSDPRMYLDIIVTNAKHNKIQSYSGILCMEVR
jgi:prephenate dehydrogenase